MAIISATRLRLRSLHYLPAFQEYAERTYSQVKLATGNIYATTRSQKRSVLPVLLWHSIYLARHQRS